jgi:pyridoxal 5'-phosphate synthase pdxS subunit
MAEMLKGGVIMDVVTPDQARIAEDAGAVAVMALERVPADIRAQGGVARMSDPDMIGQIMAAVSVPVMAKCRIGHFAEAQVLQAIGVDYVDESEVLTPADEAHHVDKHAFTVPFVCGATGLGEALRRIAEGAAMIRSKGEAGTGNVVEATRHMRQMRAGIGRLAALPADELYAAARELAAPCELVAEVAAAGRLPVVLFTAGGIATPADAAMMMQLGAEGCSWARASSSPPTRPPGPRRWSRRSRSARTRRWWPRCPAGWASPWPASAWMRCRPGSATPAAAGEPARPGRARRSPEACSGSER